MQHVRQLYAMTLGIAAVSGVNLSRRSELPCGLDIEGAATEATFNHVCRKKSQAPGTKTVGEGGGIAF